MTPSAQRYLEQLPQGLASYPECQVKGAVFNGMITELTDAHIASLPDEVRAVAESGLLATGWLPEAYYGVVVATARDVRYGGSSQAHHRGSVERNLQMFHSKMYYRLMKVLSLETLVRRSPSLWEHFHRGTVIELRWLEGRRGELEVRFPPGLFLEEQVLVISGAIQASLMFNGAADARMEITELTRSSAILTGSW